jgi:xanthine dehydrogenase YagT iron-sulfur-binding subunit
VRGRRARLRRLASRLPAAGIDVGPIAARYGVSEGPAVFVIDPEGRVSWRHVSPDALPSPNDVADALAASLAVETYDERHAVWSRRQFVATTLAVTLAIALTRRIARAEPVPAPARAVPLGSAASVRLRVNGRDLSLELEPRVTLLDALREYAGITGPKKGCDHGQCGACTVHVNGRRTLSCLTFAVMQQGKEITTVEGSPQPAALRVTPCIPCSRRSSITTASSVATARRGRSCRRPQWSASLGDQRTTMSAKP